MILSTYHRSSRLLQNAIALALLENHYLFPHEKLRSPNQKLKLR
ncbi:MAG: hypothetical protein AAGA80_08775 [Cyanobacteria bacterium P01_F01_bin.143]